MKRALSGKILTLMLTYMLASSLNIQRVKAQEEAGVEAGDFIKYQFKVNGAPPNPMDYPHWAKVEFLSVGEAGGTVRVTMNYSDSREYDDTINWSFKSGGISLDSLTGIVIPGNSIIGDVVHMMEDINVTIAGETTMISAGISRTVFNSYLDHAYPARELYYWWDKETGVLVQALILSDNGDSAFVEAKETNMWGTWSLPYHRQWWFYAAVAAIVVLSGATVYLLKRKPRANAVLPS